MSKRTILTALCLLWSSLVPAISETHKDNPIINSSIGVVEPAKDIYLCNLGVPDYLSASTLWQKSGPARYQLFELNNRQSPISEAILIVDAEGSATLSKSTLHLGSKPLTLEQAKVRFGTPRLFNQIAIFDLVSVRAGEPNIFHLELLFNPRTRQVEKYKIRGFGITNMEFVEFEKPGKDG